MQTLNKLSLGPCGTRSWPLSDEWRACSTASFTPSCVEEKQSRAYNQVQRRLGLGYDGACGCELLTFQSAERGLSEILESLEARRQSNQGTSVSSSYSEPLPQRPLHEGYSSRRQEGFNGVAWRAKRRMDKPEAVGQRHSNSSKQKRSSQTREIIPVVTLDRDIGKVGVYARLGNVSLASFGVRSIHRSQKKKVDIAKALSQMLPYVVLATAASALVHPPTFSWFSKKYYAPALGGIMLSIGVQLSVSDFLLVFKRPLPVLIGYIGQYVLKPLLGLAVVLAFRVPPTYAAGLILTASVAGAQLSSYAAYLSDGDVAFSIVLTSLTTITSVVMTPLLTQLLIGSVVPVDAMAMARSILQVVICPVLAGLALNTYARSHVDRVRPAMPLLAMVCTSLCIGSPLAMNRSMLLSVQGLQLLAPVIAFHALAFTGGYWFSRCGPWRQDERLARTISLCTGMQSSTLAMLLASQFLGCTHSVPPACSVVIMAVVGLSLGSFWGKGHQIRDYVSLGESLPRTYGQAYA